MLFLGPPYSTCNFIFSKFFCNSLQSPTTCCTLISETARLSSLRLVLHHLLVHYFLGSRQPPRLSQGNVPVKKVKDNEAFPVRSTSFIFPCGGWVLGMNACLLKRIRHKMAPPPRDAGHVDTADIDTWLHCHSRDTHTHTHTHSS
jgi:hypothetical protein